MAKRIATEYVKATMRLTEAQMNKFAHQLYDPYVSQQIKVLGGNGLEAVLAGRDGEEIHMPFNRRDGFYICECSFRLKNPRLTNVIRRMFMECKGSGQVNRIYEGFVMVYVYQEGHVVQIAEHTAENFRVLYRFRDYADELRALFANETVEREIALLRKEIDVLLELRLTCADECTRQQVDEELRAKSRRLSQLEC